ATSCSKHNAEQYATSNTVAVMVDGILGSCLVFGVWCFAGSGSVTKQQTRNTKSVPDAEAGVAARALAADGGHLDVAGQSPGHGRKKRLDVLLLALGNEFDPPVGQVAHVAADGEALGEALGRVAKPHPLDPTGVVHVSANGHGSILSGP